MTDPNERIYFRVDALLEDWRIYDDVYESDVTDCSGQAIPARHLAGLVYNHPRFTDGTRIHTSWIVGRVDAKVRTHSGSNYALGTASQDQDLDQAGVILGALAEVQGEAAR